MTSPSAIEHLFERITAVYPSQLGGIYADKPGYHNCRDELPGDDYSVQQPDDQKGPGGNGSALDVTPNDDDDLHALTQRLIDLTNQGDSRVQVLREFFGTVDGVNVTGRDVRTKRVVTSDDSHLWHLHLSVYRRWSGDTAALDDVADAILGVAPSGDTPTSETPWPVGPEEGDPEMIFVRVVDENNAIYALGPGYKHHCTSEEWGSADAAGYSYRNVNKRQRDVLFNMINAQKFKSSS